MCFFMQMKIVSNTTHRSHQQHNARYLLSGDGYGKRSAANKFDLDEKTGQLFQIAPLNRDLPDGRPQWKLFITVVNDSRDGGTVNKVIANASVVISLIDINDNSPFFPIKYYQANVTENRPIRQFVTRVTAIDNDDPRSNDGNGLIKYSIERNHLDKNGNVIFTINEHSGVLLTAVCCLDRESRPEYLIKVIATDGGGLTDSTTVSVFVLDENDEPPRFVHNVWAIEFSEEETYPLGKAILNVTVIDRDLFETNIFRFQVVNSSLTFATQRYFSMKTNSDGSGSVVIGPMFNLSALRHTYSHVRNFTIQVSDNNNFTDPLHIDFSTVVIRFKAVKPVSDNTDRPNDRFVAQRNNATLFPKHSQSSDQKPLKEYKSTGQTKVSHHDLNPCGRAHCANGATCVALYNSDRTFYCVCRNGFTGTFCNITAVNSEANNSFFNTFLLKLDGSSVIFLIMLFLAFCQLVLLCVLCLWCKRPRN